MEEVLFFHNTTIALFNLINFEVLGRVPSRNEYLADTVLKNKKISN